MIDKIKQIMQIQEQVDVLKQKMDAQSSSFDAISKESQEMKQEIEALRREMRALHNDLKESVGLFADIKEDLSKEVFDFKLLKGQLQKKLLDKFEEELREELKVNVSKFREDMQGYEEMKGSLNEMLKRLELSKQEIGKWTEISRNVKASDFELHKFARQLQSADSEKLALLQKIDNLERMVAKMRRSMPMQQVNR